MKRYLVIYLSEGEFCNDTVMAKDLPAALEAWYAKNMQYDEVYSITRAA